MREIIYIQAGSIPNYAGTHYWNTQESYFTYDEDHVSVADFSISFKEGRDIHKEPTLCPRLLAFDHKSNFGTLTKYSPVPVEEARNSQATWHGDVIHREQEQIPQSEYHSLLEHEDDPGDVEEKAIDTKIRYWSDFSRVSFDPKSIQAVPDAFETVESNWSASQEIFRRYDEDTELMEGPLRLLIEDCHNFQGMQMIQDMSTFGGFSSSFLTAFRDEYPKATILSFACLSNIAPNDVNLENSSQIKQVLNDSLSMRSLSELCDLTAPILPPPRWEKGSWFSGHRIDHESLYQFSAILSAHMETATLPLRLRGSSEDLQSFIAHLNWRQSSPFAVLGGTLYSQGSLTADDFQEIASLSLHSNGDYTPFARRDVYRGLSREDLAAFNTWDETRALRDPFFRWEHLPSYPILTSFPSIFPGPRPKTLKMMSSLSTSPSIAGSLSNFASFVESAAKRRDSALSAMGLEDDEVRELANALWGLVDGYGENEDGGGHPSENLGEDEE
ncbi:tubulin nucleotide-binding domain-like protein [Paxillus ammoniavirescens]|nr:tubulin nucleotide-binding domain-like protein [Paxillus ammoniavirescens]